MKLSDAYAVLEAFSPKSVSDEYCARYGAYDNSGILLDAGEEIEKILFSLDFSDSALDYALRTGANLLITHHPAIFGKIGSITAEDALGRKIRKAIQNGISVISMHLNFDCAAGGIDEELMHAVGGERGEIGERLAEGIGYGRAYAVAETTLSDLTKRLQTVLHTQRIWAYGGEKKIQKVASFCGGGADEKAVQYALRTGADCMVSSDFKHHVLLAAREAGLSVIQLTHYAGENYGFAKIYEKLKGSLGADSAYFTDETLL